MSVRTVSRAGVVSAGALALVLGTGAAAFASTSLTGTMDSTTSTLTTTTTSTTDVLPLPSPSPSSSLLDTVTGLLPSPSPSLATTPLPSPSTLLSPVTSLLPSPSPSPTTSSLPSAPATSAGAPLSGGGGGGGTGGGTSAGSTPQHAASGGSSAGNSSSVLPQVLPGWTMPNAALAASRLDYLPAPVALGQIPALAGTETLRLAAGSTPALAPSTDQPATPLGIGADPRQAGTILGGIAVIVALVCVGALTAGHLRVWLNLHRRGVVPA